MVDRIATSSGAEDPVDLAVRGQRDSASVTQRTDEHLAKSDTQIAAKLLGMHRSTGEKISEQTLVTVNVRNDHRSLDVGMRNERRLDLTGFDSDPVDLDLVIDTTEKVQRSVGAPAHQVTGPVEAIAWLAVGVRNKSIRGQIGPMEVAPRDSDPARVQLTGNTDRHRITVSVQYQRATLSIGLPIGTGPAASVENGCAVISTEHSVGP